MVSHTSRKATPIRGTAREAQPRNTVRDVSTLIPVLQAGDIITETQKLHVKLMSDVVPLQKHLVNIH
jgi:hypothetical protein